MKSLTAVSLAERESLPSSTTDQSYTGIHKRGVIVYVYACQDNEDELEQYEDGALGNYYN
jgi:hypothetical protein